MILAGLRNLADIITQEVQQMPILDDIMDNPLIGPKIRQGIEAGWKKGHQEGRQEGEREIVLRMAEKRFGPIPGWARQKLDAMSLADLEDTALRLLDSPGLEELLR
jgi:predicted transposase YdaD